MKRFLAVIISFAVCFCLVSCINIVQTDETFHIDETLLNKNFEFYSTEYKMDMTVSEYLAYLQDFLQSDSNCFIYEYALFDLDSDGNDELICRLGAGEDTYFRTVVFHAISEKIYSYDFTWRQFGILKTDGTTSYSLSGFDNGFGKLAFDENGWALNPFAYSEAVWGNHEIVGINYYVNGEKASKEAFNKAYEDHNNAPDVEFEKIYLDKNSFSA